MVRCAPPRDEALEVAALVGFALIAGSAFLCTSYAQEAFPPLTIAALRLSAGSCALLLLNACSGGLPALRGLTPAQGACLAFVGAANTVVPYATSAAALGEGVGVGVAAVLAGSGPLFAALFSLCALPGSAAKFRTLESVSGLLLGFAGVLLISFVKQAEKGGSAWRTTATGTGLQLAGTASKALASVAAERCNRIFGEAALPFEAQALMQAASAAALAVALALGLDCGHHTPRALDPHGLTLDSGCPAIVRAAPLRAWLSLAFLAFLGSCAVYLLQFFLLRRAGAVRQALVEYLVPIVGVVLGAVFRHEWAAVTPGRAAAFAAGTSLTLGGVALLHRPQRPIPCAEGGGLAAGAGGNPLLSPGGRVGPCR